MTVLLVLVEAVETSRKTAVESCDSFCGGSFCVFTGNILNLDQEKMT